MQVENFRAFRHAEIRLPETGLVLIAGANNSGKSALLSALDVITGNVGDVTSVRHAAAARSARVTAIFDLDGSERETVLSRASDGQSLLAGGALARLQFVYKEGQGQGLRLVEVLGDWPGEGLQPLVRERQQEEPTGNFMLEAIPAFLPGPRPASEEPRVLATRVTYGGPQGLDSLLPGQHDLAPIMQMMNAWRSRYYHFRALRPGTARSMTLASTPDLVPTGENLPAVLLDLLTNRADLLSDLRRLIAEIVLDIGQLEVRTAGNAMQVVFSAAARERNLKDLGTGVEQLLLTLVVGLTKAPPFTLLVEEPETNLHPAAQRALLGLFQGWAADRLIIAATHSPVMLDWSPGGDRLWLVTRAQGISRVESVDADPLPLLNSLGVRLSDVLSADRVLVLEGPSDEDVLAVWFPDVMRNPRVAVLDGGGGDNARYADRFATWLAGTDRAGLRQVLYLRDRDELSPEVLDKLTQSQTVHVLERRELENYLLDPEAITAVIGSLITGGRPLPDPAAVAAAMNDAADGLRRQIVVNRVARKIVPPQLLMDNELRTELAAAGAGLAQFTAVVLERLMTPADLTAQIAVAWAEAEADIATYTAPQLLPIAPGEEILDKVFMRFTGRHYKKREDGPAIARNMERPAELRDTLNDFLAD
jgi:predicted ATPase